MSHSTAQAPAEASRTDVKPVENERLHIFLSAVVTVLPMIGLGLAAWQLWNRLLHWSDVVVFAVTYLPVGLGVTVGFHRLFTHRSFKTGRFVRGALGILGSAAIEGPIITWVADHRKHHAFADLEGDPHSPHVDHGGGLLGSLRGLAHAHLGWLFLHTQRGALERYARDLLDDPVVRFVDRFTVLWIVLGLAFPFGLGVALTGSVIGGLTGLLWGGAVRVFVLHHVTYSINSLCHYFGRSRFATGDHSRNLSWLAPFSLGEAWHNNHHAFPTSAYHGLRRSEFDLSALFIRALEAFGLAWDVVRIAPERQLAKAIAA